MAHGAARANTGPSRGRGHSGDALDKTALPRKSVPSPCPPFACPRLGAVVRAWQHHRPTTTDPQAPALNLQARSIRRATNKQLTQKTQTIRKQKKTPKAPVTSWRSTNGDVHNQEKMRNALLFVADGLSLRKAAKNSLVGESSYLSVRRAWLRLFGKAPGRHCKTASDKQRREWREKIESEFVLSKQGGFQSYLTPHEELYIEELCIHMEERCMPHQEDQLRDLIAGIAQEAGHKDATRGRQFFARFYDKHPRLGLYKSPNMDIRRAEAATAHIRDSVFTKLQSLLDKLLLTGVLSQEDIKTRLDEHM